MLRICAAAGTGLAFGGAVLAELVRSARMHRVRETRARLGTLVTIEAVHPEAAGAASMVGGAFDEIDRLESLLSRHRLDTDLGRLNRTGHLAGPAPELLEVVSYAQALSAHTKGAFDVTVGPLLALYAERAARGLPMPGPAAIEEALQRVDHRRLIVSPEEIRFALPGMAVTLDGVAKGFVVDRTVASLVQAGADRVLVDAGGDLASGGAGALEEAWSVEVRGREVPSGSPPTRVGLAGTAIASSGDYMQSFTEDRSAHHILDPRSGRSPALTAEASVVAATAMEADGLSTAVMVLKPQEALALVASVPGAEVRLVGKDGSVTTSPGFG